MATPISAAATALATRFGTSQKTSSKAIVTPMYKNMAQNSPTWTVTKDKKRRPTVIPPQKPVATALPTIAEALRLFCMNTTTQPPRATGK